VNIFIIYLLLHKILISIFIYRLGKITLNEAPSRFRSSDLVHEARGSWQSMAPDRGCVGIRQALTDIGERDTAAQFASTRTQTRVSVAWRRETGAASRRGFEKGWESPYSPGDSSFGVAEKFAPRAYFARIECHVRIRENPVRGSRRRGDSCTSLTLERASETIRRDRSLRHELNFYRRLFPTLSIAPVILGDDIVATEREYTICATCSFAVRIANYRALPIEM